MKRLETLMRENQVKNILDVGTGVGNFIGSLIEIPYPFKEIVGIDTSTRAIDIAKSHFMNYQNIQFLKMDGNQMTFDDHTFDVVCLSNSLHHLTHIEQTLNEMKRVVKKNGILLFHEMISSPLTDAQISHRMIHHFSAEIDRLIGVTHNETYTKAEIEDILSIIKDKKIIASWIPVYDEKIEFSQEQIDQIIESVDRMVDRIKESPSYHDFALKGEQIKEYIRNYGFDLATEYLFVVK